MVCGHPPLKGCGRLLGRPPLVRMVAYPSPQPQKGLMSRLVFASTHLLVHQPRLSYPRFRFCRFCRTLLYSRLGLSPSTSKLCQLKLCPKPLDYVSQYALLVLAPRNGAGQIPRA